MNKNFSICAWDYGMGTDRYVGEGYKDLLSFEERVRKIGKLDKVKGIEITYPCNVDENNWDTIKPLLDECGLEIIGMGVELACHKDWMTGSLSSLDDSVRELSVKLVKGAMDFAEKIGVKTVSLWLGQDGFDYVFQNDYVKSYNYLVETLKECAKHNPRINIGLEYKVSEPKMSCLVKNAGMALAMAQATGYDNVGVTLDVGHAFNAGENPAEVASILLAQNRLFHLHVNDNYGIVDDDMPVGSVHWMQFFELFYWMEKMGYDGWYSLDIYPYRDNPDSACKASVTFMDKAIDFVTEKIPADFVTGTEKSPGEILNTIFMKFFG